MGMPSRFIPVSRYRCTGTRRFALFAMRASRSPALSSQHDSVTSFRTSSADSSSPSSAIVSIGLRTPAARIASASAGRTEASPLTCGHPSTMGPTT